MSPMIGRIQVGIYAHNSVSWFGLIVGIMIDDIWSARTPRGVSAYVRLHLLSASSTQTTFCHASHSSTSHLPIIIMTLVYIPQPGEVLIPREYQKEIFSKAQ